MAKSRLARLIPHLGRTGRAARWWRSAGPRNRPRIWAHRGDSAHQPENTLAAFEAARRAGADGIELDVRFDRDGTVCVFHDHDLRRLAGRPGRLEDLSGTERAALRIGGHHVPTLAEVLHGLGDLELDVEIKAIRPGRMGALAAATARVIARSGKAEQTLVSSFDPFALVQLHQALPDIALAYLFHDEQPLPLRRGWVGAWSGASVFHPQHTLCTEQSVRAWHAAGLPLNAWTVDDAPELERLARLGVDGVFCNDPGHALSVFARDPLSYSRIVAVVTRSHHRYTYAEYLAYEADSGMKHEYDDGDILAMAGGTRRHNALAMAVGAALYATRGECFVFQSDQRVRVTATGRTTYPDVSMVCGALEGDPTDPAGPTITNPSVIVEVLSPSTEQSDRGDKWRHYQQLPSLREYVLVSQDGPRIEHYRRIGEAWEYREHVDGTLHLECGAMLDVAAIYAGLPA